LAIARKCKALAQYSAFVGKMREYKKAGMGLEEAVKKTVDYCLKHDILKGFLEKNAAEVISMLKTELKIEDILVMRFNDSEGYGE
jgi:endonuclease IV